MHGNSVPGYSRCGRGGADSKVEDQVSPRSLVCGDLVDSAAAGVNPAQNVPPAQQQDRIGLLGASREAVGMDVPCSRQGERWAVHRPSSGARSLDLVLDPTRALKIQGLELAEKPPAWVQSSATGWPAGPPAHDLGPAPRERCPGPSAIQPCIGAQRKQTVSGLGTWGCVRGGLCPAPAPRGRHSRALRTLLQHSQHVTPGAAPAQPRRSPWLRPSAGAASGNRPVPSGVPGVPRRASQGGCLLTPGHPPVWGHENVAATPGQASAFLECAESLQGGVPLPGRRPAFPPPLLLSQLPAPLLDPPIPSWCSLLEAFLPPRHPPRVSGCSAGSWIPVLAPPVGGGRKQQLADSSPSGAGAWLQPAVASKCVR
ncbi:SH3 domain-containing protein C23A1.17-like [Pteropus medius]|uniref:SH3 domain-containing protein C23A1.17-like n=1 Tax=Pteropus vampyrus TaxID=132908 RepID=UPI00196BAF1B|nr:SH3 domain-containing protein C23A1.17-like [Pteropus giganteus]